MKSIALATALTLALLCVAAPRASRAQTGSPSAAGVYRFTLDDDFEKYLEFDATGQTDGGASGQMYFSDEAPLTFQDVDGTDDRGLPTTYKGFFVRVAFDGMKVEDNRAVIGGAVRDSNVPDLVGRRVLLTVEDNGDNTRVPDRVTWGFYKAPEGGWKVSDAEREDDPGVGLRWMASDAERKDDRPVPYPKTYEPEGPQTFSVSAYSFADAARASGDIRVNP